MKTAVLSFIFSFLLISQSNAQALKIVDLEKLFKQSNESIDTFLAGKGFEFHETNTRGGDWGDCEEITYMLHRSEGDGEIFERESCSDGSMILEYTIFDTKAYSAIKQSLSANGFAFVKQETVTDQLIFHYKKGKLYLSLSSIKGKSYMAYEISFQNEEFWN
jgi:hypothetical protein